MSLYIEAGGKNGRRHFKSPSWSPFFPPAKRNKTKPKKAFFMKTNEIHINTGYIIEGGNYTVPVVASIAFHCWKEREKFQINKISETYNIQIASLKRAVIKCQELGFFQLKNKQIIIDSEAFEKRTAHHIILPVELCHNNDYTAMEKLILALNYTWSSATGKFEIYQGLLADTLKCSLQSISRVLRSLNLKGAIKKFNCFMGKTQKTKTTIFTQWRDVFKVEFEKYAKQLWLKQQASFQSYFQASEKLKNCVLNAFKRERNKQYWNSFFAEQEKNFYIAEAIIEEEQQYLNIA